MTFQTTKRMGSGHPTHVFSTPALTWPAEQHWLGMGGGGVAGEFRALLGGEQLTTGGTQEGREESSGCQSLKSEPGWTGSARGDSGPPCLSPHLFASSSCPWPGKASLTVCNWSPSPGKPPSTNVLCSVAVSTALGRGRQHWPWALENVEGIEGKKALATCVSSFCP